MPGEPMSGASIVRPIVFLSAAAFASVATMRVADPLIPQIAQELRVSFGDASVITTAFAISYGLCQLVWGALGDRFGKYRLVALMTLLSAVTVALAGFANSLAALGAARLVAGATAAAIVPLALAFIGDHVPYEQRQTVLGRFITGTILGIIAGQIVGGVLGDLVGWRGVFFLLGGLFLLVGSLLVVELRSGRVPPPLLSDAIGPAALVEAYLRPAAPALGAGHPRDGRRSRASCSTAASPSSAPTCTTGSSSTTRSSASSSAASGLGGLLYALTVRQLLRALGERGLALVGGTIDHLRLLRGGPGRPAAHGARHRCCWAWASPCCTTRSRPTRRRWRQAPAASPSRPSPTCCSSARRQASGCAAC